MRSPIYPIRLSEEEKKEWERKSKEHGFESIAQFVKWLVHNSYLMRKRALGLSKAPSDPGSKTGEIVQSGDK